MISYNQLQVGDKVSFKNYGELQEWSEENGKPEGLVPDTDVEGLTFIKVR